MNSDQLRAEWKRKPALLPLVTALETLEKVTTNAIAATKARDQKIAEQAARIKELEGNSGPFVIDIPLPQTLPIRHSDR